MLRPAAPMLLVGMAGTVLLLGACGAPPEPLPSGPPTPLRSGGVPAGASTDPSGLPPLPGSSFPATTNPLPGTTFPTQPVIPTLPVVPTTTPPPTPAPLCGGSPTKQQMLKAVKGRSGIPSEPLEVRFGPYCDHGWQFAILGLAGQDEDKVDPLLLLTKGRATSLRVVAAGADVCDGSETNAPAGIKARACGSS
ncbi:hypothetical protein [Actinoplanes sp. NPDC049265]|uniref:hypothetical protein n=1 Tax=Actinoplanes sp. NPDC049265 TaxID=3363902 RepID=UPI003715B9C3